MEATGVFRDVLKTREKPMTAHAVCKRFLAQMNDLLLVNREQKMGCL